MNFPPPLDKIQISDNTGPGDHIQEEFRSGFLLEVGHALFSSPESLLIHIVLNPTPLLSF